MRLGRSQLLRAAAVCLPLMLAERISPAHAAIFEESAAERLLEEAGPSVVSVVLTTNGQPDGIGSGFVWDRYGHIVTNYHVVQRLAGSRSNGQAISVRLTGAGSAPADFPARILDTDPDNDLAVLQADVPADLLRPIKVGRSADLRVGQAVFAIGSPFGYSESLTAGVISGTNRAIASPVGTTIRGAVQTDAAISAGNSGGPLLDSSARLVGINTTSFTRSGMGRSSGVNFALPVDLCRERVPNMIVSGSRRLAV